MANLRKLSILTLLLSLIAGSCFSDNSEVPPAKLKNPPPSSQVFFESDLWHHAASQEWVFTHLLLSAIRTPDETWIDKLQVTNDTKESLHIIRSVFLNPDTQERVETGSMADLVYPYSWSNAGALSYMFSGLEAVKRKFTSAEKYVSDRVSFYKQYKLAALGTTGAIASLPIAYYTTKALCAAPAENPAQGMFLIRHAKNAGINLYQSALTAMTSHPYIAATLGAIYLSYETCLTTGSMYYDVPGAMMYYTDRIIGGDGSAQASTYTNMLYGFSGESAGEHFRWYINMNTYTIMLRGFLSHGKKMNQLQFGAIPPYAERLLHDVSNKASLPEMLYTPSLPDYFDLRGTEYTTARAQHRKHVTEVVSQAVNVNSPADDCRKFVLFNDALFSKEAEPLYLFSLCSVGDTFAYARLPGLPYVRLEKTGVPAFVQGLMEYTGSTRLVVMSEKK